jgi:GTP-binding protein
MPERFFKEDKRRMKLNSAEFAGAFVSPAQLPEADRPEFAVLGRSNVGKSSLINKVLGRRGLAKSSSTPGKTRTINYYAIRADGAPWYLVDLPGYGYAKAPKTEKARWGKMTERYILKRETLRGVFLLLDIRHAPSRDDEAVFAWLRENGVPLLPVANKSDKLSRAQQLKQLALIRQALALPADYDIISFSAVTGEGAEAVREAIAEIVFGAPENSPAYEGSV